MKTTLTKHFLPGLIAITAAIGAMLNWEATTETTLVQGYINTPDGSCILSDLCSTTGVQYCTVGDVTGATRLWGKHSNGLCIIPLYRPQS